jgi:hypothetical protein
LVNAYLMDQQATDYELELFLHNCLMIILPPKWNIPFMRLPLDKD